MKIDEQIERETKYGTMPVLRAERIWGFADFSWVNVGLAIATWAFLTGGATATLVGLRAGIAACIIGNAIAVAVTLLTSTVPSARYGVQQYSYLRTVFGAGGVLLIVFGIVLIGQTAWSAVLGVMFGRAFTEVSNQTLGTEFGPNALPVSLFAILALVLGWLILVRGPTALRAFNRVVAPGLAIVSVIMLAMIFSDTSITELLAAEPIAPFEDPRLNFVLAVEFNLGVGFSWWPIMGNLARLSTTPATALWAPYVALVGAWTVAQTVGLAAALAFGVSDPTAWMVPLGGLGFGVFALLFVGFANITSLAAIVYSTCLTFRQVGGSLLERLRWEVLCAGFFVLPGVLSFFPGLLYDQVLVFVTWVGSMLAAICGTVAADYFILRRQRIGLRALYSVGDSSAYHFTRGFNISAIVATSLGTTAYVLLFNPSTAETSGPFEWITASVPAVAIAASVHVVLSQILYIRRGQGGYETPSGFPDGEPTAMAGQR